MADEIYTFRTVRIVDNLSQTTNIIADQEEDVIIFEAGANVELTVVDDRVIISTESPIGFTGSRGFTGSIGFTGSRGFQGSRGYQGSRGFDGSRGFTGSIGFTGSQGVQGLTGSKGDLGYTGSRGERSVVPGYTGSEGIRGPTGPQGNIGFTGSRGTTGFNGSKGDRGFTGSQGFVGFTGSLGPEGFTGSQGTVGPLGYTGSRGSRGYAGSRGFTGSRGIQGIQGIPGIRGYTGSQGNTGPLGQTGYSGSRGFVGSTGYTGSRGPIGPQGQPGVGLTGSRGPQGPQGEQGLPAEAFRTFRTPNPDGTTSLIIADQPEDVMTFVAGDGMSIEFNEATDTITFVSTGGGGGGGGNANVIPTLTVLNNAPDKDSFIAYDSDTGVLEYTPYDLSNLAETSDVVNLYKQSTDHANAIVAAEADLRAEADQDLYQYVQDEVNRIDAELASNVIIINNTIDQANVYLQGLIQDEANIRANADNNLQAQIDALTETAANILLDLDGNVLILQQELQQIEANSIARDEQLQDNIDVVADGLAQEILDRIAGDQAVQDNLDANITLVNGRIDIVEQDLSDEANARAASDSLLQAQINTNKTDIANVASNLAQEIIDRESGDDNLQNQILNLSGNVTTNADGLAQEILDRIDGDNQVQANLDQAVNVINIELDALGNAIQLEANIRANADSALSDRIDVEKVRNDGQDGEISDLDIRVSELESRVEFSIDYETNLVELGQPNTQQPEEGNLIPLDSGNIVTNMWEDTRVLYMNATDDEGTFHFLDGIKKGDDLVFQHRTQNSYCRFEVTANVELVSTAALSGEANIQVVPVAFNGEIEPGNGDVSSHYVVQFYPNVAGDVPNYAYVDAQDARRVLKTGDIMSGTLEMRGGDVVAYGNTGSRIRAVQGADVDIADDGSLVISGTGSVSTNKISNVGGGDLTIENGGAGSIVVGYSATTFINRVAKYSSSTATQAGLNDFNLIHKGYLDTRLTDLDLGNTYVAKAGDTMTGQLSWSNSAINAMSITPVEGSLTNINYFDEPTTQLTAVDIKLRGNSDTSRFRILGGEGAANTMVAFTSSGKIVYNTDVSMNGLKITDVGDPVAASDVVNLGYLDNLVDERNADLANVYVAVAGDTMTGELTITGGGLRVTNSEDIQVEGGDVRVINGGNVVVNTWKSVGNSNMAIKRNNSTKLNIYSSHTLSPQPIRYNSGVAIADDYDLITKSYVDDGFIKRNAETEITDTTTIRLDSAGGTPAFRVRGHSGISFELKTENNSTLFYSRGSDVRLANNDANNDNSVLNRSQMDERYGLKGDFLEKSGGTMTGKLTLNDTLEFGRDHTQLIRINPAGGTTQQINLFEGNAGGQILKVNLQGATYQNAIEFESGPSANKDVILRLDSNNGIRIHGLNMDGTKIKNVADPTDPQDAATMNYVDEKIKGIGGGDFIKANGDTDITTESTITLKGVKLNIKSENSGTGFQIKRSDGQTLLYSFGNDMRLVNNDANSDTSILNRNQLDLRYLNQDGFSILTQNTTIKANNNAKFLVQNAQNNSNNFFKILNYSGSELFGVDGDGMTRVARTPSEDTHVANKKYVDDQIKTVGFKTWPGRRFTYQGTVGSSVHTGKFSSSGDSIYVSVQDLDGMRVNEGSPDFTPGVTMTFCIYENSGGTWRRRGFATYGGLKTDFRTDYWHFRIESWKQGSANAWTVGGTYAITCSEW